MQLLSELGRLRVNFFDFVVLIDRFIEFVELKVDVTL